MVREELSLNRAPESSNPRLTTAYLDKTSNAAVANDCDRTAPACRINSLNVGFERIQVERLGCARISDIVPF